jgi:hypothetical protein
MIIHAAKLSNLDDKLAESDFEPDISPWTDPSKWIQANAIRVASITQEIITLTNRREIGDVIADHMLYPRLTLYIFIRLTLGTNNMLLNEFKETLRKWKTYDWLTMIQNHQSIRDVLYRFQKGLNLHLDFNSKTLLKKLLTLDVVYLASCLAVAVTDDAKYKTFIDQQGLNAQSLINLLQARLDFSIAPAHKISHLKALIKLCRASGLCPECLVLKGVEIDFVPVAGGGYGDIYKGCFKGQQIAVKVLKIGQDNSRLLKEFASEAVIWRQLSHPNVLPFCGVYHIDDRTPRVCLVSPWLEDGNVVEFLNRNGDTDCVQLALDIASGLEYLHGLTPSIIHGDLKGVNVLVTPHRRACLADFGLATARDSQASVVTQNSTGRSGGTIRWQAPELHVFGSESSSGSRLQRGSRASDIYAFACVCYEMFSGRLPFYEIASDFPVITGVLSGRRPVRPWHELSRKRGLTKEVWDLVEACWAQDLTKRPTATQVVERLRSLPNRPMDQRRFGGIPVPIPSQTVYTMTDHPFSALVPNNEDDDNMQRLKWISR